MFNVLLCTRVQVNKPKGTGVLSICIFCILYHLLCVIYIFFMFSVRRQMRRCSLAIKIADPNDTNLDKQRWKWKQKPRHKGAICFPLWTRALTVTEWIIVLIMCYCVTNGFVVMKQIRGCCFFISNPACGEVKEKKEKMQMKADTSELTARQCCKYFCLIARTALDYKHTTEWIQSVLTSWPQPA